MKKLLAVLLAGTMALSLAACGGGKTTAGTAKKAAAGNAGGRPTGICLHAPRGRGGRQTTSRYGYKSSGRYDGCRHGECGSRRKGRRGYGTDRPS